MEQQFLEFIRDRSSQAKNRSEGIGIGDDAAVLPWPHGEDVVVCSDLISDEVDFHLFEVDPVRIGRKSVAINLSDIAAMACRPRGVILTLLLPRNTGISSDTLELAKQIYRGAEAIAHEYDCPMLGGDTNTWDGKLAISVTVLGSCPGGRPLRRSGARTGDLICVTGPLGGSILGHHFDFSPRVREALWLNDHLMLNAGMDISDGLALDLSRLCQASKVGAELVADQIPISAAAEQLSQTTGRKPLEHALEDGEDFELLITLPPDQVARLHAEQSAGRAPSEVQLIPIGKVVADKGLTLIEPSGDSRPLEPGGYQH